MKLSGRIVRLALAQLLTGACHRACAALKLFNFLCSDRADVLNKLCFRRTYMQLSVSASALVTL